MEPIKLIEKLCEIGSTEQCGVYVHDPANLRTTFGEYNAIQTAKNSRFIVGQAYVYDYKCEISDTPDVMIFTKDAPDDPIGLYKIDGQRKMAQCETLSKSEYFVRICPITNKPVLAQYLGNDEIIELHNDSVKIDIKEVNQFIKQNS